jgi:hypothetical protein
MHHAKGSAMITEDRWPEIQIVSPIAQTAKHRGCEYVQLVAKTFNNQDGQPYMVSVREHCGDVVTHPSRGRCDRHARSFQKAC